MPDMLGDIFQGVELTESEIDSMFSGVEEDDAFWGLGSGDDFGFGAVKKKKKTVYSKVKARTVTRKKATKYPWQIAPKTWGVGGSLINFGVFVGLIFVGVFVANKALRLGKRGVFEFSEARDRFKQQRSISDLKQPEY